MDNNQLKCTICGGQFNSQDEMGKHAKEAHSNKANEGHEEHSMMCSKCGIKAKSENDLNEHAQTHMGS